jgi:1-acyl-sn-glycerol-3-phosphate acyltransferase
MGEMSSIFSDARKRDAGWSNARPGQRGLVYHLVTGGIHRLAHLLCRIYAEELARVPRHGPLILVMNHVNFLDVPVVYTELLPRPLTGFAKTETWDSPAMAFLFDLWGAIPLRRGEADVGALRQGLEALSRGQILAITPEGTRSGDGRLRRSHPGVALLAFHSQAPLLPLAIYGGECFRHNLARLHRTDIHLAVGQLCTLRPGLQPLNREVRQRIADELMYQVAALLPPEYRGEYANLVAASQLLAIQPFIP